MSCRALLVQYASNSMSSTGADNWQVFASAIPKLNPSLTAAIKICMAKRFDGCSCMILSQAICDVLVILFVLRLCFLVPFLIQKCISLVASAELMNSTQMTCIPLYNPKEDRAGKHLTFDSHSRLAMGRLFPEGIDLCQAQKRSCISVSQVLC